MSKVSRAVELVAKEAERSHRTFEDVANMDTDDAAGTPTTGNCPETLGTVKHNVKLC